MMWRPAARRVALILLAQHAPQIGGQMQASTDEGCAVDFDSGNCICTDASGTSWDLGVDVGTLGPIMGPCNGIFCSGQWQYYVGICANIPVFQGIGCSSAALTSAFRIDTWAACPPSTSCECELMGINMQSEMTIGVSALEGDEGVLLQNVRDTGRSIEISVICDRSVTSDNLPDPVTDAANHVSMTWRTPLVCAGAEFGWLFLIATGLAAGVYVGGGIGYGKHLDPQASLAPSTHPHFELWQQLPDLVHDGVTFVKAKIMGVPTGLPADVVKSLDDVETDRLVDSSETGEATTKAKKSSRQSKRDVVGEGCGTGAQEKQRARKKRKKKPKPKPVADVEAVGLE